MYFQNLSLKNYRNFVKLNTEFHPNFNLFIGENGHGKTNLIEALYVLVNGNSFRTNNTENLIGQSKTDQNSGTFLKTSIVRGLLHDEIVGQFDRSGKTFFLNEKKSSTLKLKEKFPHIIFSPESLMAIKSGPEHRRELLDELVENSLEFGPAPIENFKKVLRTKNRVLKDHLKLNSPSQKTQSLLDSINPSFLRAATLLTKARIEMILAISNFYQDIYLNITNTKNVDISVEYVISDQVANGWSIEAIYNALNQRINELTVAEMVSGNSLVGPHKHDVKFLYNGKDSRFFCSQGQQRALILAFKITQIVYHRQTHDVSPILFLDDVLSELDAAKREYLLKFLRDHESQTFITTTDIAQLGDFSSKDTAMFQIQEGILKKTAGI